MGEVERAVWRRVRHSSRNASILLDASWLLTLRRPCKTRDNATRKSSAPQLVEPSIALACRTASSCVIRVAHSMAMRRIMLFSSSPAQILQHSQSFIKAQLVCGLPACDCLPSSKAWPLCRALLPHSMRAPTTAGAESTSPSPQQPHKQDHRTTSLTT